MVPEVVVAGITVVAPATMTDDDWDGDIVVVVDDPVVDVVDVVDDVDDVTGATGTATGSSPVAYQLQLMSTPKKLDRC